MSAAPKGSKYGTRENPYVYHLNVSGGEEQESVVVTTSPVHKTLIKGEWIHFKSNRPGTAIRFLETSPFFDPDTEDGEPRAWQVYELGTDGKYAVVVRPEAEAKFECGYRNKYGDFEAWPGKGGNAPGGNDGD